MTPRQIYNSIERGWSQLAYANGAWLADKDGNHISNATPIRNQRWADDEGKVMKPCYACAIGALMYDKRITQAEAIRLIDASGKSSDEVMQWNDDATNKVSARNAIKKYLLS